MKSIIVFTLLVASTYATSLTTSSTVKKVPDAAKPILQGILDAYDNPWTQLYLNAFYEAIPAFKEPLKNWLDTFVSQVRAVMDNNADPKDMLASLTELIDLLNSAISYFTYVDDGAKYLKSLFDGVNTPKMPDIISGLVGKRNIFEKVENDVKHIWDNILDKLMIAFLKTMNGIPLFESKI